MPNERSVVKSSTASDGGIVIEYDDGSKETMYSMSNNNKKTALTVVGSSSTGKGKKGSSSSSYKGSTSSYNSGSWGGHGSYSYASAKPKLAFTAHGMQFWGSPKHKLDDVIFEDGDLIINCTGTKWKPKAPPVPKIFAKETPEWMQLPEVLLTPTKPHNYGERAQQLLLDWPDMKTPPEEADLDFWITILEQAKSNGIKRVIACCTAGQGRTGTALSALLLACGAVDEPDLAIDYIRDNYNDKAVETKPQEEYIFGLIYEPIEDDNDISINNKTL